MTSPRSSIATNEAIFLALPAARLHGVRAIDEGEQVHAIQ